MKKHSQKLWISLGIFLLIILLMTTQVPAQTRVSLIESSLLQTQTVDQSKISDLVTKIFHLDTSNTQQISVKVKPIFNPHQSTPDYLIVYLLQKDSYSFQTNKVDLNPDYRVENVSYNYQETAQDELQTQKEIKAEFGDDEIEAFFATCNTEFPTAIDGVKKAAEIAQNAGYKVKTLIGSTATVSAYKYWMQRPRLKIFGNIGHGSTSGIMLADGSLSYSWFNTLATNALNNKVLYFNSCKVHNNPLEGAILQAGAQKFIGGDINLLVGPSEKVFQKFWDLTLIQRQQMTPSLAQAEKETNYPEENAHGISGNGSEYVVKPDQISPTPTPSHIPSPNPSNIASSTPTINPSPTPTTNLALNKPTTASSSLSSDYLPQNAVDGNQESRWAATSDSAQWLQVDLTQTYSINKVKIIWSQSNYPKTYSLQRLEGTEWINIKTITSDGNVDLISFDTIKTQKIRINCTQANSSYYVVYEFEIYGTENPTPTPTPTPNKKNLIITAVNDNLNNQDMYLFANGLSKIGYTKTLENTNVTTSALRGYIGRNDITTVYHTGHGNNGIIMTADGSLGYSGTTVNVENFIIATCLTLSNTAWKNTFGSNAKNILGYTNTSLDITDNQVVQDMTSALANGQSYMKAWYTANVKQNSLSDRWCGYVRENNDIVEYSARNGNLPRTTSGNRDWINCGNLQIDAALYYDYSLPKLKLSNLYQNTSNHASQVIEENNLDNQEFLSKSSLTTADALQIAAIWLEKNSLAANFNLTKIIPIEVLSETEQPKTIAYLLRYERELDGLRIVGNRSTDHLALLINNKQVSASSLMITNFTTLPVTKLSLLSPGKALQIAVPEIARHLKTPQLRLIKACLCYGFDGQALIPAYELLSENGESIVISALDGTILP